MRSISLDVDCLARVEGEGGLQIRIKDQQVVETRVKIFEPPRFFEAVLRGRHFTDVPDMVARICGICPVPHQLCACQAVEAAFGAVIDPRITLLRRLMSCGGWIQNHALHIYLLHAPDFLGYEDALRMARDHPQLSEPALRMKKLGNSIVRVIGGREIHPVNLCVGGFYRVPSRRELQALMSEIEWARGAAKAMVEWTTGLEFPLFEQECEYVALHDSHDYAMNEGRIASIGGLNISVTEYERHFAEEHVPHSNALHSLMDGCTPYVCGPVARYNLNSGQWPTELQTTARAAGLDHPCRNPFRSITIRALELWYAVEQARALIETYDPPTAPAATLQVRSAPGRSAVEAPRGLLFHRYNFDPHGLVVDARIIPPTSQNQRMMEQDVQAFAQQRVSMPKDKLLQQCERVIRNYDPCISCATH